ncbi:YihY/virulence factor BrkB family protein [Botrimarina sp.]|uniref:YihY/virulence factor BrkB family protein n=1 Tax=Botrimarina sp. TaxID=2795802 RepID=UPI0032EF9484
MKFLKQVFLEFGQDHCGMLAAALSYYTLFALPPLMYLLMMVLTAGLSVAYDSDAAEKEAARVLEDQAAQLLGGEEAAEQVSTMIDRADRSGNKWWKALLGVAGVMLGATGLLATLQRSLNLVWSVKADPDRPLFKVFLRQRFVAFAVILGMGVLLLASVAASAVIGYLGDTAETVLGVRPVSAAVTAYVVQAVIAFVAFAVLFKVLPEVKVAWSDVVVGSLITTVLFLAGRVAIQQYFAFNNPAARVGSAAASLAVILAWVYYSSMILLFGAEATQVYANRHGSGVRLKRRAVRIVESIERPE